MANVIFDSNSRVYLSNATDATGSTVIGYQAGASIGDGDDFNVFIGHQVADASMTNATKNVGVGYQALSALAQGDKNIAIGYNSSVALDDGTDNVTIGNQAGDSLTSGSGNVAIGADALGASTDVDRAIVIGADAGGADMTSAADGTIAIGFGAGAAITGGARNMAIGYGAGTALTTSSDNIIIGYGAMDTATTNANKNIAIGNYALDACTATAVVGDNVAVGYNAGTGITDGDQNTFIGNYAGDEPTTGQNNTCIGYGSDTGAIGSSNQTAIGYACVAVNQDNSVTIGGAAVTNVYMSQDSDATVHCGQVTSGSDVINNGNLYSSGTSGTHYCGLSNQRWHTVYGVNSNFSSDQTLKKNIATSDLGIDFIKSLNPVKFNWKKSFGDDTKQHYGFLAQEIKETPLEDSVDGEEGEMGMNYNELIAPMVKAIQELSAEVEKLKENA